MAEPKKRLVELTDEEYDLILSAIIYQRWCIEKLGVSDTTRETHHKLVALEKKLSVNRS